MGAAAGGQPAGGKVGQQVASNGLNGGVGAAGVTGEQEELVAKMLASGMDEATAYQYPQQLCGGAGKGMTPEAKALMEQILASNGSKEEIASRVKALLDGSELSSSRGMNGGFDGKAEELLRLQYRASLDRIMKMSIYDNKSAYDIQFMVNEFMFNSANLSEARSGKLDMDSL